MENASSENNPSCYSPNNFGSNSISSSCIEYILILASIISLGEIIYLVSQLAVKFITFYCQIFMFLVLTIIFICLLFNIFYKIWRYKETILTNKKNSN